MLRPRPPESEVVPWIALLIAILLLLGALSWWGYDKWSALP